MASIQLPNGHLLPIPDGSTPEQAQSYYTQALRLQQNPNTPASADTFLGESGLGALGGLLGQGWDAITSSNTGQSANPAGRVGQLVWNTLKGAYQGQAQETQQEQEAAGADLKQGNLAGNLSHLIGSVPAIGHPIEHLAYNTTHGNLGGAAGDLFGLFGGELMKGLAGAAGEAFQSGANPLYRSSVNFPQSLSKQRAVNAAETALQEKIPTGDKSIPMGQAPGRTGDFINQEMAARQQYLTGQNGAQPISMRTALKDAQEAIVKAARDKTPEGQQHVSDMIDELNGWQQAHPNGLNVAQAEDIKESMYGRVSPAQRADNTTPIPGAPKVIKEELARGLKNAVAEVHPQVDYHNQRIQSGIDLQDALKNEAKTKPKIAQTALLWSLGPIIGEAATTMGHSNMGMNGLIALAAGQALAEPAVASRLALAFHGSGDVLKSLSRMPRVVGQAGQAVGQLASRSSQQQQPPDLMGSLLGYLGRAAQNTGAPLVSLNNLLGIPIKQ